MTPLLEVKGLDIRFQAQGGNFIHAVRGVDFSVHEGECVAIVGESGSGKSVSVLSVADLVAGQPLRQGSIQLDGRELIEADSQGLLGLRGGDIGFVFQEPMTSLNPLQTIEVQISEALKLHQTLSAQQIRARVIDSLDDVGIEKPQDRLGAYPHQLSGGQRQRVMIAMALINRPRLLIADEPTTALDVTTQARILDLLRRIRQKHGMSLLFVTHNLRIVRALAERVYIMKNGQMIENGSVSAVFNRPKANYTRALLEAEPSGRPIPFSESAPEILSAKGLGVRFPIERGILKRVCGFVEAVKPVDFSLHAGETLGVVGESGSGKTSLALALLRLIKSQGGINLEGRRIDPLKSMALRPLRKRMQIVFQDPFGSLSPRLSVDKIVAEGLDAHEKLTAVERQARVSAALEQVGLDPSVGGRYPHEFSGGQRQRIAIARAMILCPKLLVLDEPTSALDQTVQAQIIDLLHELQREHALAYIFISHDLSVIEALSHKVLVMRQGSVVEAGSTEQIFNAPKNDYTKELLVSAGKRFPR